MPFIKDAKIAFSTDPSSSSLVLDENTAPSTSSTQIAIFHDQSDNKLKQRAPNNGTVSELGSGGGGGGVDEATVEEIVWLNSPL